MWAWAWGNSLRKWKLPHAKVVTGKIDITECFSGGQFGSVPKKNLQNMHTYYSMYSVQNTLPSFSRKEFIIGYYEDYRIIRTVKDIQGWASRNNSQRHTI